MLPEIAEEMTRRGPRAEIAEIEGCGHAPGLVCLRVDDILLTADHVLSRITPHQAPESITAHMGLAHYFESLRKIELLEGIRIGLGGHEAPIENVSARCREIQSSHDERLDQVLAACDEPRTMGEISRAIFGSLHGYNVLLGLEEQVQVVHPSLLVVQVYPSESR